MRFARHPLLISLLSLVELGCGGKSTSGDGPSEGAPRNETRFVVLESVPEALHTEWAALSGDGLAVVGSASLPSAGVARLAPMVWDGAGSVRPLEPAPPGESKLTGAGNAHVMLGGITTAFGSYQPFLSRSGDILIVPETGSLEGMSPDARWVAGSYLYIPDFVHAYRWSEATGRVDLGTLEDADHSSASGISDDGRIVIGKSDERAYVWSEDDGMRELARAPGFTFSEAVALSRDGSVVAGSVRTSDAALERAVRWVDGELEELHALPGVEASRARAASADGAVIVGASGEAAIWTEDGVQSIRSLLENAGIDVEGWTFEIAIDVSLDGTIVLGTGDYDGETRAWLAELR